MKYLSSYGSASHMWDGEWRNVKPSRRSPSRYPVALCGYVGSENNITDAPVSRVCKLCQRKAEAREKAEKGREDT